MHFIDIILCLFVNYDVIFDITFLYLEPDIFTLPWPLALKSVWFICLEIEMKKKNRIFLLIFL